MGLFSALSIGTRSMEVAQQAMEIAGHNLSNVNTEGYSRQRVEFVSSKPQTYVTPSGSYQVGSGVDIASIKRIRDEFAHTQLVKENATYHKYLAEYNTYQLMEVSFNEPSDKSIAANLSNFFQSWSELSAPNPTDPGKRQEVRAMSVTLVDSFQSTYNQLDSLQTSINDQLESTIIEINAILEGLAALNEQISHTPAGVEPNHILDERDQLLLDLAQYTNFMVTEQDDSSIDVSVGGTSLLINNSAEQLELTQIAGSTQPVIQILNKDNIVTFKEGKFAGLLNMRDNEIQSYKDQLNELATTLMDEVNTVHHEGYDENGAPGGNFFTGNDITDMAVNSQITNDISYIAAASSPIDVAGNGENAKSIADIQDAKIYNDDKTDITVFYQNTLSSLANDAGFSKNITTNQASLVTSYQEIVESVSGVSMDEELADLLKYQQTYQSAAKFISIVNTFMDTLLTIV